MLAQGHLPLTGTAASRPLSAINEQVQRYGALAGQPLPVFRMSERVWVTQSALSAFHLAHIFVPDADIAGGPAIYIDAEPGPQLRITEAYKAGDQTLEVRDSPYQNSAEGE